MTKDRQLRDHLLYLLRGGNAHISFDDLVADFPLQLINHQIQGLPYTAWQILEHLRIAQSDILEFTRNPSYVSPKFPEGYWPAGGVVATMDRWNETVASFRSDLDDLTNMVNDLSLDLLAPLQHGDGQTILREVLLVADHNAYHLGALAVLKRILTQSPSANQKSI